MMPAPAWPRGEAAILRERIGPVGVALWQSARDIRLWAETDASTRRGLFRGGTSAVLRCGMAELPELEEAFERIASLVRYPDLATGPEIAVAATQIARWAEENQLLQTALEFAEAAALADPGSSPTASLAGRLARRAGENGRSAAWYRRAIGLARNDHNAYIRAQLGYGGVMFQIGSYGPARLAFRRASRLAVKYSLRGLAAEANHDLLSIACDVGSYEDGAAAAEKALERYPLRHPRLPHLAHDYAYLLMRNQYFRASVPILTQVRDMVRHHERVVVCGTLARSAAAIGDRVLFEKCCEEVLRGAAVSEEYAAQALIHVAAGAVSFRDWELAGRLAADALEIARRRGNKRPEADAEELMRDVSTRSGGEQSMARDAPLAVQLTVGMFLRKLAKRGSGGGDR